MLKGKITKLLKSEQISIKGEHNVMNALAAATASLAAGAKVSAVKESLKLFKGMPYRQEIVGKKKGVIFVNDTTSTTPDAAIAALKAFSDEKMTIHWICGGADKGLDYTDLMKLASKKRLTIHLLVGTAYDKLMKAFKSYKMKPIKAESLKQAFDSAVSLSKSRDVILLSPACASFGLFKNEFDRGDQFNLLVKKLDS